MSSQTSTPPEPDTIALAGAPGIRAFCELVLRPGAPAIKIVIRTPSDRGRQLWPRTFAGGQSQDAIDWIGRAQEVFVPLHVNYNQWAAAVCLPQGGDSVALAFFQPPPSFAIVLDDDHTVYAVWLYNRCVRDSLSQSIARRLNARPSARIPLGGSRRWNRDHYTPCRMLPLSNNVYDPGNLEDAVRRQRRGRPAA